MNNFQERETESEPRGYSIPRDQFIERGGTLENPETYTFPHQVTRDNFASFLSLTFSRARGDNAAFWAQCEWLRIHENFDYITTFRNFILNATTLSFSEAELKMFREDFDSIPGHEERGVLISRDLVPNIYRIITPPQLFQTTFPEETIKQWENPRALLKGINTYLKAKHAARINLTNP